MPYNEFIVGDENISIGDVSWSEYGVVINGLVVSPQASIDDDLLNYFNDSLEWIKSTGPSSSFPGNGLDRYGYTIIKDMVSLGTFMRIITSWKNLFNNAPNEIIITGDYGWNADSETGFYEKITFNKFELVESLNNLIEVTETAIKNNQCVIHFGI